MQRESRKEYHRTYYEKNKEWFYEYFKKYRSERKEHCYKLNKEWLLKNKKRRSKYVNNYERNKRKTNLTFKLKQNLRSRIYGALKGRYKSKKTIILLGCTIEELWIHLEKTFKEGMTRENYGVWHVDHIKPCASFDLSKPEEQAKCFHYTNLQALWASENLSKKDKIL